MKSTVEVTLKNIGNVVAKWNAVQWLKNNEAIGDLPNCANTAG
jgi:hypothetical protein